MQKKLQRGLCVLLCVIMAFSCAVVPAGAVTPAIAALAPLVKDAVANWLIGTVVEDALQAFKDWVDGKTTDPTRYIAPIGALRTAQKTEVTEERLRELAYEWNITCSEAVGFTVDVVNHKLDTGEVYRIIAVRRGYVVTTAATQWCLADGMQRILYCDATTELSGRWAPADESTGRQMLDYDTFWNLKEEVGGIIREVDGGVFWEIVNRAGEVYCNPSGRRFSFNYANSNLAINANRPTTGGTIIEGDTITNIENNDNSVTNNDYSQDIDIENMQQALPGGIINNIDNLIYDDNTKTYYVDSHDVTNNVTQNFLYEYHINYTSITYIGQTEEYNKRYELYYQLPDGRDSADLTREELEQLNVDIDVIPYVRSTDNVDVRSLYHFDADTRDSSYWNYITEFEWITGASLTYMESGAFNGALYLDENQHAFRMTMPQATDTAGDWTLQWRYYQSHTIAPVNDSSVYVGDKPVMTMDGQRFYTPGGAQISVIPTGSWNEVCIIRSGGKLHYYVNGVFYLSEEDANYRTDSIRFIFGREQQTNKQLDELRFCRGVIYTPGENYSPTSVPHDSNLTLILPTGKDVVVDEVAVYKPSENNLFNGTGWEDLRNCTTSDNPVARSQRDYDAYYDIDDYTADGSFEPRWTTGYPFVYDRDDVSVYIRTSHLYFSFKGTRFSAYSDKDPNHYRQTKNSVSFPLFYNVFWASSGVVDQKYCFGDWQVDQVYTLSVVLEDLSFSSITFRIFEDSKKCYACEVLSVERNSQIQFSVEELGCVDGGWDDEWEEPEYERIFPVTALCFNSSTQSAPISYMELVAGDAPAFTVDYETAVYDEGQLTYSPTLAVRTDVPITDHQIGGVRPSVPEKGQVWALVESGYITSLQVYTGSVWINCDGRIWTGQRWIPASSYNVITLQDMYDIVDSTQDYEYIYTESGFWSWLQNAWKDMIARLDKIIEGLDAKKGNSSNSCDHVYDVTDEGEPSCSDHSRKSYTCSICGDVFVELVDPLGHAWPFDPHVLAIVQQPQNVTAPVGGQYAFLVVAVGDGLKYQWQYKVPTESGWSTYSSRGKEALHEGTVASYADGYQFRCRVTDSSGTTVVSNVVTLTIGELNQPPVVSPVVHCSRCGVTGEVYNGGIVSADGVPEEAFSVPDLLGGVFDGAWTVVTGVISTGFDGLTGFVEGFSVLPDFFALYRPSNQAGVLGIQNYRGDDIWD